MGITMWIWICVGLAVLCFALFLLFLVSSMNFVHQAKPKQSLVKQSMFTEYRITNTINIMTTRCKFLRNLQRVFVNFKIKNGTIYQKSTVDICTQLR